MAGKFQPSLYEGAFHCLICGVNAPHKHFNVDLGGNVFSDIELDLKSFGTGKPIPQKLKNINTGKFSTGNSGERPRNPGSGWNLYISVCTYCFKYTIWVNENVIFPAELNTPAPSLNMPEDVKEIYKEAQLVYENSPRAASALLRLAIETLIPKLEYGINPNKTLFEMIGELVEKKIPEYIQKGLDSIRYYGNKGIHTAEIDMKDDRESVFFLFTLCNLIVEELITKEKEVADFYNLMPERFRLSVNKRDN